MSLGTRKGVVMISKDTKDNTWAVAKFHVHTDKKNQVLLDKNYTPIYI